MLEEGAMMALGACDKMGEGWWMGRGTDTRAMGLLTIELSLGFPLLFVESSWPNILTSCPLTPLTPYCVVAKDAIPSDCAAVEAPARTGGSKIGVDSDILTIKSIVKRHVTFQYL